MLARYLEELNTSTQICFKTSSLGEDNIYADISSMTATPPLYFGAWQLLQLADVSINVVLTQRTGFRAVV